MQITTKSPKKHFHNKPFNNQVIPFSFYFLNQILNQHNFILSNFLQYKKYKQAYFATWLFTLKHFQKQIKNTKQIQRNFYPELRGFGVMIPQRWQRTLVLPNQ